VERRVFLSTIPGGLLAAPFAAEAQEAGKGHRIGFLGNVLLKESRGVASGGALIEGWRSPTDRIFM